MKKRLISLFMTLVLVLSFSLVTALPVSAAQTATLTAPTRTLDEDATFNVPITITQTGDPMNCVAFDFKIKVTQGTLTLNSVIAGALLPGSWSVYKGDKQTGGGFNWWVVAGDMGIGGTPVSGSDVLVILNFTAAADFDDTESTALDLYDATFANNADPPGAIAMTLVDGTATVDLLEVTAIGVVGGNTATSEGYVTASDEHTTFTMTPTYSGGSGTGYTYSWNFGTDGSGTTNVEVPIDVDYSTPLSKTITLRVTDGDTSTSEGHEASGAATIYANLAAAFLGSTGTAGHLQEGIARPSGGAFVSTVNYPTLVTFTPSPTGGKTPYLYTGTAGWDFNADSTIDSHETSPAFDYSNYATIDFTGTVGQYSYNVYLTVKDSLVASDLLSKAAYITVYRAGNVNMDASIGAADLTKMRLVILGTDAATFTSDVNDDTLINSLDVAMLLIYLA